MNASMLKTQNVLLAGELRSPSPSSSSRSRNNHQRGKRQKKQPLKSQSISATSLDQQAKKIVLITGGNTGLGFESMKGIARHNNGDDYKVIIACRSVERGRQAVRKIGDLAAADVDVMELDLASFRSVREFAREFLRKYERLDVLMNNAGIMALPERKETEDKNELQMQTNHLGHFLLTKLLLERVFDTEKVCEEEGSAMPRVVNVSSVAHNFCVDMQNINSTGFLFGYPAWGWVTYGRTKMANVLYTYELQQRLRKAGSKVKVYAVHPGVVDTELQRNLPIDWYVNLREAGKLITPPEGARGQIYLAISKELENDEGGKYMSELSDENKPGKHEFRKSNDFSLDSENWARLWKESERIIGISYDDVLLKK